MLRRSRPLGALEHCVLSLSNVGVPSTVVLAAIVNGDKAPLQARLPSAIATLLERYPLLRCQIVDAKTDAPYWLEDGSLQPEQVIGDDEPFSGGADTRTILQEALVLANRLDGSKSPTWRVWLAHAPLSGQTRVVLGVSHVVTDGSGARDLMADLLSLLRDDSGLEGTATTLANSEDLPPSLETVLARLPASAHASAAATATEANLSDPFYLRTPPSPPHLQPSAVRLVKLPASIVAAVKSEAKANGVATLHAVLYIAALVALQRSSGAALVAIKGSTPVSARILEQELPRATGNYVYEVNTTHDSGALSIPFWQACAAYAQRLIDPATRSHGLEEMRQLAGIPSTVINEASPCPERSAFDRWRLAQLTQPDAFQTTFEVSNLGVTPPTGWEGEDGLVELVWAQSAMLRTAFAFNPISTRSGDFSLSLTFRDGAVAHSLADTIARDYEKILRRIAAGAIGPGTTCRDM